MMRSMCSRALRAAVIALAALSALQATRAQAETLPAFAQVRASRSVEATTFRQLVETRYQVEFRKVVATDIDRDGDIDVLATTDRSLTVWVNDGVGHLTSQRRESDPSIDSRPRSNTFREHDERPEPSANTYSQT